MVDHGYRAVLDTISDTSYPTEQKIMAFGVPDVYRYRVPYWYDVCYDHVARCPYDGTEYPLRGVVLVLPSL